MPRGEPTGITLAASQFPVSGNVERNTRYVVEHISRAAADGADVVLFPEAALTGYPRVDRESLDDLDQEHYVDCLWRVREAAAEAGIWALVGGAHAVSEERRPTNCVYVIGPDGRLRTRYDKAMLYNAEQEHYSPGLSPTTFDLDGIRCGVLICFDSCFPERYAELEQRGVRVLFHAYYNARTRPKADFERMMLAQVIGRALDHSFAIVGSNSSARHSAMPSCIALPDGRLSRLTRHAAGVVVTRIEAADAFWRFRRSTSKPIRGALAARARARPHPRITNKRASP